MFSKEVENVTSIAPVAQTPFDPIGDFLERTASLLPNILVAAALVLAGYVGARIMKAISVRLLKIWSNRLAGRVGKLFRNKDLEARLRRTGSDKPLAESVGRFVFWLVFLLFLVAATQALGLPVISTWVAGLAGYFPRVLAAALVFLIGVLGGNIARNAVKATATRASFAYADLLGRITQTVIIMITLVVAFDQLGLEITFLIVILAIVTATMLGGAALAFGLGAQDAVANIIASHYILKTFRVGHQVQIEGVQGRILEITPTAVVIASPEGRIVVPSKLFNEQTSRLITS